MAQTGSELKQRRSQKVTEYKRKSDCKAGLTGLLHCRQGIAGGWRRAQGAGNIKVQDIGLVTAIAVCACEESGRHGGYEVRRIAGSAACGRTGYRCPLWRICEGIAAFLIGRGRDGWIQNHGAVARGGCAYRAQDREARGITVIPRRLVLRRSCIDRANRGSRPCLVGRDLGPQEVRDCQRRDDQNDRNNNEQLD
jgi:hypothetical protein